MEKQAPMFRDVTGPPKPQNLAAWRSSRPPGPARPCQSWSLHSEPWSPDRAIGGWALVSTSQRQGKQPCEEPVGGGTSMWGGKLGEGTSHVRSWASFGGTAMWGAEPGDGGTKTQAWHQGDSLPQHSLLQQPQSQGGQKQVLSPCYHCFYLRPYTTHRSFIAPLRAPRSCWLELLWLWWALLLVPSCPPCLPRGTKQMGPTPHKHRHVVVLL